MKRKTVEARMIEGLAPARAVGDSHLPTPSQAPFVVGHGYDIHRLQTGGKLMIGGVAVSEEISAVAHSDGDVALHALVDAILGALGLGDIGQHFPNTDERWKDADSRRFVDEAMRRMSRFRYSLANVDLTLLLEKPKIAPHRHSIVESIHTMVGRTVTVNLKAGTNEGCDAVGRGEAVACHAVVLLMKTK